MLLRAGCNKDVLRFADDRPRERYVLEYCLTQIEIALVSLRALVARGFTFHTRNCLALTRRKVSKGNSLESTIAGRISMT